MRLYRMLKSWSLYCRRLSSKDFYRIFFSGLHSFTVEISVTIVCFFHRDASCVDPLTLCEDVSMENAEVDVEVRMFTHKKPLQYCSKALGKKLPLRLLD